MPNDLFLTLSRLKREKEEGKQQGKGKKLDGINLSVAPQIRVYNASAVERAEKEEDIPMSSAPARDHVAKLFE
jgi:hypothetical protein